MRFPLISMVLAGLLLPGMVYAEPSTPVEATVDSASSSPVAVVDRSKAPGAEGEFPQMVFQRVEKRTLKNGIDVWFIHRDTVPLTHVMLVFNDSGARRDPLGKYGLAECMTELIDKGCGSRSATEFAQACYSLGATFEQAATWDSITSGMSLPRRNLKQGLELLGDVTLRPHFSQEELDRVKRSALVAFKQSRSQPSALAGVAFRRAVFGRDSRYGTLLSGTASHYANFTREDVLSYYCSYILPINCSIVVSGSFDVDETLALLNQQFGNWLEPDEGMLKELDGRPVADIEVLQTDLPSSKTYIPEDCDLAVCRRITPGSIYVIDRPGSPQSVIRVGCRGVSVKDSEFMAFTLGNNILGGSFNSRLNMNLREKNGYTYGVSSNFDKRLERGAFGISTTVQTDKTVDAVREIYKEIDGIRHPVSEEELARAKSYLSYTFPNRFQSGAGLCSSYAMLRSLGLSEFVYKSYIPYMQQISRRDVLEAMARVINPQNLKTVIVGDANLIAEQLKKVGWCARKFTPDDVMGEEVAIPVTDSGVTD